MATNLIGSVWMWCDSCGRLTVHRVVRTVVTLEPRAYCARKLSFRELEDNYPDVHPGPKGAGDTECGNSLTEETRLAVAITRALNSNVQLPLLDCEAKRRK